MSKKRPVVVYGVSGYTGRLVCEYLREYNVPFVAAGRDGKRVREVVEKIPGIENADYEVVEVAQDVHALTELFRGSKVVCNVVGPFIKYGGPVVEACLAAGCHYTDTTGEQDWVLKCADEWGESFAKKGLLLSPNLAQMYTTGEIAANIALETPGLDTLDILVFWKGFPTYASTQTIFTILKANWYYLEQKKFVEWDVTARADVVVPGQHETAIAVPWGGTAHPVWFRNDPRVANCKAMGGVLSRPVMEGVVQTTQMVKQNIKPLAARPAGGGTRQDRGEPAGFHAAARKSPRQHLAGFGLRVGTARAQARRHPRQLQLQTDRHAAGLRRLSSVAAAAAAGRFRLGLSGLRAPRLARPVAQLRAGDEPDRDDPRIGGAIARAAAQSAPPSCASLRTQSPCCSPTIWTRAPRSAPRSRA